MKKLLFTAAAFVALTAFQSCSKCGHCHTETTTTSGGTTTTTKTDDPISCGSTTDKEATLSLLKAQELNCKAWPGTQPVISGYSYTSSWMSDK